jgi:hypothetical protein
MTKYRIVMRYKGGVTSYVVQRRFLFIWNDTNNKGESYCLNFHTLAEAKKDMYICVYGNRPDVVLKVELEE